MSDASTPIPTVDVGDGQIPVLGLGTWQNTGPQCAETVEMALNMGYRHIDTAQAYGNEAQVGEGLRAANVPRDEIFLTTKVWRTNLRPDDVRSSVRASLRALGVDTVDLLLVHWPHPLVPIEETLGAMAELRDEGRARHLGVSNFTRGQLSDAMRATDAPLVTDQVLYHPYIDQSALRAFCANSNVALTAYSPLARGAVLSDDVLTTIGNRHDKSAAQVALRWLIQQENVVAIPKATSREHLAQNLAIFDFSLSEEEMDTVGARRGPLAPRIQQLATSLMRRLPFTPV